jgi:V/A-type H+-transporting ATPase subunit E
MSGLENIINIIRDDAAAEAKAVLDRALEDAARYLSEAKAVTDKECGQIVEEGQRRAEVIHTRAEADAAMERRRALLARKQELLDRAVLLAREAVLSLPEGEYFDFLTRLAAQNAEQGAGVMSLSKKDLTRLPEGFHAALNRALPEGAAIDISANAAPIDGGFILQYGEIDRNCSLTAIFDENRERILDAAQDALFQ